MGSYLLCDTRGPWSVWFHAASTSRSVRLLPTPRPVWPGLSGISFLVLQEQCPSSRVPTASLFPAPIEAVWPACEFALVPSLQTHPCTCLGQAGLCVPWTDLPRRLSRFPGGSVEGSTFKLGDEQVRLPAARRGCRRKCGCEAVVFFDRQSGHDQFMKGNRDSYLTVASALFLQGAATLSEAEHFLQWALEQWGGGSTLLWDIWD